MKNQKLYGIAFLFLFIATQSIFSQTLKKGDWDRQNKSIKGTWEIIQKSDGNYIVFSDDFKTKKAPDLELFLSKKSAKDINKKKVVQEAVSISKLKSHKGKQSYKLPSNINIEDFSSLIIHCRDYNIFWGAGNL